MKTIFALHVLARWRSLLEARVGWFPHEPRLVMAGAAFRWAKTVNQSDILSFVACMMEVTWSFMLNGSIDKRAMPFSAIVSKLVYIDTTPVNLGVRY